MARWRGTTGGTRRRLRSTLQGRRDPQWRSRPLPAPRICPGCREETERDSGLFEHLATELETASRRSLVRKIVNCTTAPTARIAAPTSSTRRRLHHHETANGTAIAAPAGELRAATTSNGIRAHQRSRFQPSMMTGHSAAHQNVYSRMPNVSGLTGQSTIANAISAFIPRPPQRDSGMTRIRTVNANTPVVDQYISTARCPNEIEAANGSRMVAGRIRYPSTGRRAPNHPPSRKWRTTMPSSSQM